MSSQRRQRRWTHLIRGFRCLGFFPRQNPYLEGRTACRRQPRKWLALLGPPFGWPWKFQSESGTPCVCVNWSQAHYLACSRLNLPPESTPFVERCSRSLEAGGSQQLHHSRQVCVGEDVRLPFVMSSGRLCVFRYAFPETEKGSAGLLLCKERTSSIEHQSKIEYGTLKKFFYYYLFTWLFFLSFSFFFLQKMHKTCHMEEICMRQKHTQNVFLYI